MRHSLPRVRVPPALIYAAFGVAAIAATSPVWGLVLFGVDPTLDLLLQMRCF
jgi:hypothetical protein